MLAEHTRKQGLPGPSSEIARQVSRAAGGSRRRRRAAQKKGSAHTDAATTKGTSTSTVPNAIQQHLSLP